MDLDIFFLVVLRYIIFKTPIGHFVRNYNYQVLIFYLNLKVVFGGYDILLEA